MLRTYEEELQVLAVVRDELKTVASEKTTLQTQLSSLEVKYKVMETLRDSQETELQTLKVPRQLLTRGGLAPLCPVVVGTFTIKLAQLEMGISELLSFSCSNIAWLQMKLSVHESTLARLQGTIREMEEEVSSLRETVGQQKDELHAGEMERRQLHNTIQELKASVAGR